MTLVKLYIDWASQPSRAVVAFCEIHKVKFVVKETRLFKEEEHAPEYVKNINPAGQVPAMQEIDEQTGQVLFTLAESCAIMRYLVLSRGIDTHWYPIADHQKRAKIDSWLDWHHNWLRNGLSNYLVKKLYGKCIYGKPFSEDVLQVYWRLLISSLKFLEAELADKKFLGGFEEPTIADL